MRLIDADALRKSLFNGGENFDRVNGNEHFICGIETAIEAIDYAPTIDPVKHGRWIAGGDMYDEYFTCSNCEEPFVIFDVSKFYYCPNCGARMDGEADEL